MSEHTKDPGAHWGEILDFWKEIKSTPQEGEPDLEEYPLAGFGDWEIWRQAWGRTPVVFHASLVLQKLVCARYNCRCSQDSPQSTLEYQQYLEVLDRLIAQRRKPELEGFYAKNPDVPRLSAWARSYVCTGWMIRYSDPGYIDYRKK